MTAPEHTQLDDLRAAVEDLQRERQESRDTVLRVTGEIATVVDWGIRGTLSYLPRGS